LGRKQLASGESTELTLDVDVARTYMHKFATCVLKTDHPRLKDWAYTVELVSLPFAVAEPKVLNLGTFKLDDRSLNAVQHATLDLFADTKIELSQDHFTVPEELELKISSKPRVRRLQRDIWDTRHRVSIGLSPKGREKVLHNSRPGIITKAVQLTVGKSRHWQYSVYWQTLASLESHPSYLSFGNALDYNDDRHGSVTISSTTNEKFRIVHIKNHAGDTRIESNVDTTSEAPRHRVQFRLRAPGHWGNGARAADEPVRFLSGTIQVETTDKLQPMVEIPWSAMLTPSAKARPKPGRSGTSSE
jgi:hypothetical protein